MLVSTRWLREWVDFDLDAPALADLLTMLGLEVESVTALVACHSDIVVGRVQKVEAIADSEKLKLCQVDVGSNRDAVKVVCGAPQVTVGKNYPIALPGSVLPNGKTIEKADVRGIASAGMLCSGTEIGVSDDSSQLLALDGSAKPGVSVSEHLELPDEIIDIDLTPNRGDCLSIKGIAREIAAATGAKIKPTAYRTELISASAPLVAVKISAEADCPIYCSCLIEGIRSDVQTPGWMRLRLHRAGIRCIHPIVDVTNYVMLECGQPMHAFDADRISGHDIIVRHSRQGECLTLLDGVELKLHDQTLLIADSTDPIGLAGVMGGESTGIHDRTSNVFLESAFFTPDTIRHTVSEYGIHTDASHRFERGVAPHLQSAAMHDAVQLIKQIAGGSVSQIQQSCTGDSPYLQPKQCVVREARIARVLGVQIPPNKIESILQAVNTQVTRIEGGWEVTAPARRFDLLKEHDQLEEIARFHGYDKIPSRLRSNTDCSIANSESQVPHDVLRSVLHARGYYEAITYSFVDPALQAAVKPAASARVLANPIAENLSVMRTSLWPGLIGAFMENYRRRQERICLYEIGNVFDAHAERTMIGGIAFGRFTPKQWSLESRSIDFFDVKADVMSLFEQTRQTHALRFTAEPIEGLYPGCSSAIYFKNHFCGAAGKVHPELLDDLRLEQEVFAFEVNLSALSEKLVFQFQPTSPYPSVTRDIAIVVDTHLPIDTVSEAIWKVAGKYLNELMLFDVYSEIDAEIKAISVAYRLVYRSQDRTLTDDEIDASIETILESLNQRYGVTLRN